jgi:hypothetical protein
VQNAVKGTGGLQIDADAGLVLGGSTASGSTAAFNGAGAALTLDKPAEFASTIGGVALDEVIKEGGKATIQPRMALLIGAPMRGRR